MVAHSIRNVLRLAATSALLVAGLRPAALVAQAQAATGLVRGVVTDSAGSPIASATIVLRNLQTNGERSITTNTRGVFVASLLRVGTYDITARAIGYGAVSRKGVAVRLGEAAQADFALARRAVQLQDLSVQANRSEELQSAVASAVRLDTALTAGLPNNGRNFLALTLLTPNAAIVQGPDGDELSIGGQRGIHNNVSVDGADFNNPFFGEQRGGQRPAFTFNLDAVQEMVVVSQGANAEFGRSSGGFVNVLTKSGTNQLKGSFHYFGKSGQISASPSYAGVSTEPDFTQHQFGFTLGGPIKKDKAFFFLAYDQQVYRDTKQKDRLGLIDPALKAWTDTAYGGALNGDFGPIKRTNDANALMAKLDFRLSDKTSASLKYNYTNSRQENGTFDVDYWGASANGLEKDYSHAVNGSINSALSNSVSNEFRFQFAREDRPRPYTGPTNPSTGRPFPDTDISFTGFRIGMPFFLPVQSHDTRVQVLDNISFVKGNHFFKAGVEFNRTEEVQTFIGFGNGRMAFTSVNGFLNYVKFGNSYVECDNGASSTTGSCPSGAAINGPVLLYLQQAGVGGKTVEQAGTQSIPVTELSLFLQDSWKPASNLTVDYGLRWEMQQLPDPQTPADQVFFAPFIGQTVTNSTGSYTFPSDGKIHSDRGMFQPRFGVSWDPGDDGNSMLRASAGLYYARIPGLNLASIRSTNGSIGQTLFRSSDTPFLGLPPTYGQLLPSPSGGPFQPGVFVMDKDFRNPRTMSASLAYDTKLGSSGFRGSLAYAYARTDFLTRFVNRNDAVFGKPWATGLAGGNGIGDLTVVEATGKSRYQGFTVGLAKVNNPNLQFEVSYTLGFDKSDDDNERDPFSFRYAKANNFAPEYNWSDRDQRHRINGWLLAKAPGNIYLNNRISYYSAQPVSEKCVNNAASGKRAVGQGDRICGDGTILLRNTLRKDNAFFTWDLRVSHPMKIGNNTLEAVVEIFNVTGAENFKDASSAGLFLNFDGTIRSGFGDPRQVQAGMRYIF